MTSYWLVKSEPGSYSIDDLRSEGATWWTGVRNYQARNFLQNMKKGDHVLFYHSNSEPPGIAGLASVIATAEADETQFDRKGEYFDPKATKEKPRWFCPQIRFVKEFKQVIGLADIKKQKGLASMELVRQGSRLSVQPVTEQEFEIIAAIAKSLKDK